ncbi:uncharacterized protein LOC120337749 [Styela clava]
MTKYAIFGQHETNDESEIINSSANGNSDEQVNGELLTNSKTNNRMTSNDSISQQSLHTKIVGTESGGNDKKPIPPPKIIQQCEFPTSIQLMEDTKSRIREKDMIADNNERFATEPQPTQQFNEIPTLQSLCSGLLTRQCFGEIDSDTEYRNSGNSSQNISSLPTEYAGKECETETYSKTYLCNKEKTMSDTQPEESSNVNQHKEKAASMSKYNDTQSTIQESKKTLISNILNSTNNVEVTLGKVAITSKKNIFSHTTRNQPTSQNFKESLFGQNTGKKLEIPGKISKRSTRKVTPENTKNQSPNLKLKRKQDTAKFPNGTKDVYEPVSKTRKTEISLKTFNPKTQAKTIEYFFKPVIANSTSQNRGKTPTCGQNSKPLWNFTKKGCESTIAVPKEPSKEESCTKADDSALHQRKNCLKNRQQSTDGILTLPLHKNNGRMNHEKNPYLKKNKTKRSTRLGNWKAKDFPRIQSIPHRPLPFENVVGTTEIQRKKEIFTAMRILFSTGLISTEKSQDTYHVSQKNCKEISGQNADIARCSQVQSGEKKSNQPTKPCFVRMTKLQLHS